MPDLALSTRTAEQIHQIAVAAKNEICHRERILTACLLEIDKRCLHFDWGTSTTAHYAEAILQLDGHTAREYMRTGRALEGLPKLAEAYYAGQVSRGKIREITRVATVDTEDFWLDAAAHHNTRQIEMMVARTHKGRKPGEPGGDDGKPRPLKTRVTLDFEPEQMAIVREALDRVCQVAGERVALADAIELMAQEFLNTAQSEADVGNRYRLVIHADPSSRLAWVNSASGTSRVSDETLAQALCDAEVIDLRRSGDEQPRVDINGDDCCDQAAPERPTWDAAHPAASPHAHHAAHPADNDEAEDRDDHPSHPVWDTLADIGRGVMTRAQAARLTRTVPPAVMRHVMARDQYRCSVPGCEMRIWKEVHHIEWRVDGGRHDTENLVLLCTRHHRMVHRGQLSVCGAPSGGLAWRDQHGRVLQGSAASAG